MNIDKTFESLIEESKLETPMRSVLVTGGCGFIGSNFINRLYERGFRGDIINADKLTYAGDENYIDSEVQNSQGYQLFRYDIANKAMVDELFYYCDIDTVVHFAAETHVDNSIGGPAPFIESNIIGTFNLLEAARYHKRRIERFHHISCYDEETRALTLDGIKRFDEIKAGDMMLSLNPSTKELEHKKVIKVIIQDYEGELIRFDSKRVDLSVTPNHNMFFTKKFDEQRRVYKQSAEDIFGRTGLRLPSGQWNGIKNRLTVVDGIGNVSTEDLFYISGIFIGDGFTAYQEKILESKSGLTKKERDEDLRCRDNLGRFKKTLKLGSIEEVKCNSYRVYIDIPEMDECRNHVEECLSRLGIDYHTEKNKSGEHIYFTSEYWMKYFDQFGSGAKNKHIPRWMLDYDMCYLKQLFNGLIDSDGNWRQDGNYSVLTTTSKRLKDDCLELAFKLGMFPGYKRYDGRTAIIEGRKIIGAGAYYIYFGYRPQSISKEVQYKQPYNGKIWCLRVEDNKNFIVERNGKLAICGNTDEVFGEVWDGKFKESTPYDPSSPYSASKAAADHLVRAYARTYNIPITISNCSNNYGPRQHHEKLIPVIINNALDGKPIPIYGKGKNVRDWLFVTDHCDAIIKIISDGVAGDTYLVGGDCELTNIALCGNICSMLNVMEPREDGKAYNEQITFVEDRPGHDFRYAIDFGKINRHMGWEPKVELMEGLSRTISWYLKQRKKKEPVEDKL